MEKQRSYLRLICRCPPIKGGVEKGLKEYPALIGFTRIEDKGIYDDEHCYLLLSFADENKREKFIIKKISRLITQVKISANLQKKLPWMKKQIEEMKWLEEGDVFRYELV